MGAGESVQDPGLMSLLYEGWMSRMRRMSGLSICNQTLYARRKKQSFA
jgi:hypothetical protein